MMTAESPCFSDPCVGALAHLSRQGGSVNLAVFRALNLGDMLCTVPALRALRQCLPQAHIVLIGLENARPVAERFPNYVDELVCFPGDPAFPEQAADFQALPPFYRAMRARCFDLVLQMHGSGQQSNAIVEKMAPRQWGGFVPSVNLAQPGRLLPWPDDLHEVHRYLALLQYLGVEAADDRLEFPLHQNEHRQAEALARQYGLRRDKTVFVHAGARLASRRWPLPRFAAVVSALIQKGWQVVLTGSAGESGMAQRIAALTDSPHSVVNMCGTTSLGVLAALLQRGRLLICNDTGVSHVAAAVRVPSVVIASGSDVRRWAPLDSRRHTVLHADTDCRPCAFDECPVGHRCALGVEVEHVLEHVYAYLSAGAPS